MFSLFKKRFDRYETKYIESLHKKMWETLQAKAAKLSNQLQIHALTAIFVPDQESWLRIQRSVSADAGWW